jgi:hypothetical protein
VTTQITILGLIAAFGALMFSTAKPHDRRGIGLGFGIWLVFLLAEIVVVGVE